MRTIDSPTLNLGLPNRHIMVFDVESIGLHGEGFAVSWCILDLETGSISELQTHACDTALAVGLNDDRNWVTNNVPALATNCNSPKEVRAKFWQTWLHWRNQNALLAADAAWPVETNFLSACINDIGPSEHFSGPYPLIDIDALASCSGQRFTKNLIRLPHELPLHDPAADTQFSARRLLSLLTGLSSIN